MLPEIWAWFAANIVPLFNNLFLFFFLALRRVFFNPVVLVFCKISAVIVIAVELWFWSLDKMSESIDSVQFIQMFSPDGAILRYGSFMNRFVPLVESIAAIGIVFQFWILVTVFRWLKSLIPFISN